MRSYQSNSRFHGRSGRSGHSISLKAKSIHFTNRAKTMCVRGGQLLINKFVCLNFSDLRFFVCLSKRKISQTESRSVADQNLTYSTLSVKQVQYALFHSRLQPPLTHIFGHYRACQANRNLCIYLLVSPNEGPGPGHIRPSSIARPHHFQWKINYSLLNVLVQLVRSSLFYGRRLSEPQFSIRHLNTKSSHLVFKSKNENK